MTTSGIFRVSRAPPRFLEWRRGAVGPHPTLLSAPAAGDLRTSDSGRTQKSYRRMRPNASATTALRFE